MTKDWFTDMFFLNAGHKILQSNVYTAVDIFIDMESEIIISGNIRRHAYANTLCDTEIRV